MMPHNLANMLEPLGYRFELGPFMVSELHFNKQRDFESKEDMGDVSQTSGEMRTGATGFPEPGAEAGAEQNIHEEAVAEHSPNLAEDKLETIQTSSPGRTDEQMGLHPCDHVTEHPATQRAGPGTALRSRAAVLPAPS